MKLKMYTVRCHVPQQDLDIEVLALDMNNARRLVGAELEGIEHGIESVSELP